MTFEEVAKWVKDQVEMIPESVYPEIGHSRNTPCGGEYQEWVIGSGSEFPSFLLERAQILVRSIKHYYSLQQLEPNVLPFSGEVEYPPPRQRRTLYWRVMPEAGVAGDNKSRIYARFTIR